MFGNQFAQLRSVLLKASIFYLTLILLLIDPFNLSIGHFIYGCDANVIDEGIGIKRSIIQIILFIIRIVNHELVALKLLSMWHVKTNHLFLKLWVPSSRWISHQER
jgi:hypothetical protein